MILLLSITLPIILIFYILHKTKPRAVTTLPPGPPPLPLIGNIHQLGRAAEPHIYLHHLSKKYGPIIHMKLATRPLLVISSAKLAKQVLKTEDLTFCSRPNFLGQQKLSYNSSDVAFTPYNERWKEIRKMSHIHLLSNKKVQSYRHVREEEISRMITEISSSTSKEVNLSEVVLSTGIHILSRITFGKRYEEGGSGTKMSGRVKRADVMCKEMDSFYQELIDEHLESKKMEEEEEDMLAELMKLKIDDESSSGLTLDNIKALLMVSLVFKCRESHY
ncbi:6,7,8-trihydroxycoumarin synthase-like [Salvia hispanica]|uniref:6,7,8-trihydroxycoumarin synthase-like n=1 Tax=Salvia hispanica TaxID=49212 RepID=UPI00200971B9|nr:6,7,8-trihydroxycoumarin synthase-like [Salvia hispanica]